MTSLNIWLEFDSRLIYIYIYIWQKMAVKFLNGSTVKVIYGIEFLEIVYVIYSVGSRVSFCKSWWRLLVQ